MGSIMKLSIQSRVAAILISESKTITMLLGMIGLFLGIGFIIGDSGSMDYHPLLMLFDSWIWATIFLLYSFLKFSQIVQKVPDRVRIFNSTLGMWLWTYVLISFLIYDPKPVSPAEILLLVPLVCEVIELVIDLYHSKRHRSIMKETSQ